jgi:hypothetical protein
MISDKPLSPDGYAAYYTRGATSSGVIVAGGISALRALVAANVLLGALASVLIIARFGAEGIGPARPSRSWQPR